MASQNITFFEQCVMEDLERMERQISILREALEWIERHAMDRDITKVALEALNSAGGGE